MLNTVTLAPMPTARVRRAAMRNPGRRRQPADGVGEMSWSSVDMSIPTTKARAITARVFRRFASPRRWRTPAAPFVSGVSLSAAGHFSTNGVNVV